MKGANMEVFIHDKNKKAYYVFPWGKATANAKVEVAREKHINPDRLEAVPGWVKDDELFLEHKKGAEKVLVVMKHTKLG
jgi:hypothetical protein